jgi:hypothetical protein
MKVELHINGTVNVILIPETAIEATVVRDMVDGADKGKAVRITSGDIEGMIVSVEK